MNKEPYNFETITLEGADFACRFVSVGKKGNITKVVAFQNVYDEVYNMALLDYDENAQTSDDEIVSDNGDMSKVLSTTWQIMLYFLLTFPEKSVAIHGNTPTRQKLYNRLITNNLIILKQHYEVLGVSEVGTTEVFNISKEYFFIIIQPIKI